MPRFVSITQWAAVAMALAAAPFAATAQPAQAGGQAQVRADASVSIAPVQAGAQVQAGARAEAQAQADPSPPSQAQADAARKSPGCLTQTGSHLRSRGGTSCAGHGRSFDRDDLQRTGETDVGQALRKLDPRLR